MTPDNAAPVRKLRKTLKKRKTRKVVQKKPVTEDKIVKTAQIVRPPEESFASAMGAATLPPDPETKGPASVPTKSNARKERVPFGAARLRLTAPQRPGYKRRWVNDVGGALEQAQDGWYEFVTDDGLKIGETAVGSGNQDLGSRVSRIVGTLRNGQPQRAYLMEIKDEYYQEDQETKQKRLDVTDNQIRGGTFNPDNDNDMKRYVPAEGISVK